MEFENKVLAKEILSVAYLSGKTLATAESCTAGKLASSICAVPGSSNYFKGGIVSYATEVKVSLLGVNQKTIDEHTVVSEEVAKEMVKGAIRVLDVDYAVASTGYAGPSAGDDGVPVGTIWLACGNRDEQVAIKLTEDNGRDQNLVVATHTALNLLLDFIREKEADVLNADEAEHEPVLKDINEAK